MSKWRTRRVFLEEIEYFGGISRGREEQEPRGREDGDDLVDEEPELGLEEGQKFVSNLSLGEQKGNPSLPPSRGTREKKITWPVARVVRVLLPLPLGWEEKC